MRIVVCVKHVPDIQADRTLSDEGRVVRDGGDGTLNELDENAVEEALRLVEAAGEGEVVALTVGPEPAVDAVRRALQMGAHEAVHVLDPGLEGSDYFGTAHALAGAVRVLASDAPVDLVVCGMAALDGLGSIVPALLAAELGLPGLSYATSVEVSGGVVQVYRDGDGVHELLRAALPAVVSVTDAINSPRFASFAGMMAARSRSVRVLDLAAIAVSPQDVGLAAARTRVVSAAPRPEREPVVLVRDDGSGVGGRALADFLISRELV